MMLIDGHEYHKDIFGVVHQSDQKITQIYDLDYVRQRYDSIPDKVRQMSLLRAGYVTGVITNYPSNVLDIGYGNGDFLFMMNHLGSDTYGYDITGYSIKEHSTMLTGIHDAQPYALVTMFDSLEHIADIDFIENLVTELICITTPYYNPGLGDNWFAAWKHRRYGEHLHHFSADGLNQMMKRWGYEEISRCSIEDLIRGSDEEGRTNTLTMMFRMKR